MDKTDLKQALDALEETMDEIDKSTNTPGEGEIRSLGNAKLARQLGIFGVHVAQLEEATNKASDRYDFLRQSKVIEYSADNPMGKSESMAKINSEVLDALEVQRRRQYALKVVQTKSRSIHAYLDASRSRLSWIKADVHNVA